MNNLFFFAWSILRKFVRSLFKASVAKFIIVSIALVSILYYYVKCNEIPSTEDAIMIEKVAGVESEQAIAAINIHRNYSAAFSKNLYRFIPEYDSLFVGSYNTIELISTARRHFLHAPSTFKPLITGWDVDDYIDYAEKHTDGIQFIPHDSIDVIYTIWQAFELTSSRFAAKPEANVGIRNDNSTNFFSIWSQLMTIRKIKLLHLPRSVMLSVLSKNLTT